MYDKYIHVPTYNNSLHFTARLTQNLPIVENDLFIYQLLQLVIFKVDRSIALDNSH